MKRKLLVLLGTIPVALILFFAATAIGKSRGSVNFKDNLDEVIFRIDGEEVLLSELKFYVLFEEQKVEEQARIYNPDSPKDYWNTHTNGAFTQLEAKDAIIGMAIHDKIMYDEASKNHTVLSSDEKEKLEEARSKFWQSLFEEQLELLPLDYNEGNRIMKEIAIIEAYQRDLAKEEPNVTYEGLAWDGYDFEQIKKEHDVKINDKLWDRIAVGDISLIHDNVNYINGLTNEEKEQLKDRKEWKRLR